MLDGDVTDAVEARSLGLNNQHIDIYSARLAIGPFVSYTYILIPTQGDQVFVSNFRQMGFIPKGR